MQYCTIREVEEFRILRDIGNMSGHHAMKNLSQQMEGHGYEREEKKERYKEDLREYDEEMAYEVMDEILRGVEVEELKERLRRDERRKEKEKRLKSLIWAEGIEDRAMERALMEYKKEGYISIERGMIKITAKGARILARGILKEVMERKGERKGLRPPFINKNYGSKRSSFLRNYEPGDDYELVSIEETLLNALERSNSLLKLKNEDFRIHKALQKKKVVVGLIIDKSGSMRYNGKIDAAVETSLALSELINLYSDELRIFVFSEEAKEVAHWELLNTTVRGNTDIRGGLKAFRKVALREALQNQKYAYLLTDTEPNTEDGVYVGFKKAAQGVLEEARQYKKEDIALNVITFDDNPYLVKLGRGIARNSSGRFFIAAPEDLTDFVVEDYMKIKERIA